MRLAMEDDYVLTGRQLDTLERAVGNLMALTGSLNISAGMDIREAYALLRDVRREQHKATE